MARKLPQGSPVSARLLRLGTRSVAIFLWTPGRFGLQVAESTQANTFDVRTVVTDADTDADASVQHIIISYQHIISFHESCLLIGT